MTVIKTHDLTRYYGSICGVKELSFCVPEGSIFGFIGANGAGKTTTIRLLLGLIKPNRGEIEILHQDLARNKTSILQEVGYLPGELHLYPHVSGERLLNLFASFYHQGFRGRKRALEALELSKKDLKRPFRDYSLGMKQKLGLVQALQHQPELLILDEPTTGLDPVIQRNFHQLIEEVNGGGTTIFLSSHNLPEVESCCDEVAIICHGELVARESLGVMKEERWTTIEVSFSSEVDREDLFIPGTKLITYKNGEATLELEGDIKSVLARFSLLPLSSLEVKEASLEEIFLDYYDGGVGDL